MRSVLVVAAMLSISIVFGYALLWRRVLPFVRLDCNRLSPSERLIFSAAVGLGVMAYGIFAIGMCGWLKQPVVVALLALMAMPAFRSAVPIFRDVADVVKSLAAGADRHEESLSNRVVVLALWLTLVALLLIAMVSCYLPPTTHAWDALAYHLAAPKIFVREAGIHLLPTQHHSNFPFTVEMLFTVGLMFDGYVAANLVHLSLLVILVLAVAEFGARYFGRLAGASAALLLVSTPVVHWEATVAYIDLGLALYVFLAIYALILAQTEQTGSASFIGLSGAMAGWAIGVKYLALIPLALFALIIFCQRGTGNRLRRVVIFICVSVVIGCPWYIKNALWVHNPVYPFAYSLFPQSLYWNSAIAAGYAEEQKSFGSEHSVSNFGVAFRNLVSTPWYLVGYSETPGPSPGHDARVTGPDIYTNVGDFTFASLVGGGAVALFLSGMASQGAHQTRQGRAAYLMLLLCSGTLFVTWFFISQHVRYLITLLPFLCLLAGVAVSFKGARRPGGIHRVCQATSLSLIFGQSFLVAWPILFLPVAGSEAAALQSAGIPVSAWSFGEAWSAMWSADRLEASGRRLSSYEAMAWVNNNTPANAGVVLYDEPHGYYLDRRYLWGNDGHSLYIPYGQFHRSSDLTEWLHRHGIEYAIFNLNFAQGNSSHERIPDDSAAVSTIMQQWYVPQTPGWTGIVGEAIKSGEWRIEFARKGVVVLKLGAGAQ